MDEVNINKYLGQFNPILIVPVLSAVFGAILVFVFGFKRPNEPKFQSSSDSLKKSKRKANAAKNTENIVQSSKQSHTSSAKVSSGGKKIGDASAGISGKKGAGNEKPSGAGNNNNNNTSSNNNNNVNKKKTDEKKSENGSPAKKLANKKIAKETTAAANKKLKANKNNASDDKEKTEKPVDFDDGGWFTVQSKSGKQKNKSDESAVNSTDNSSPKAQQNLTKANVKSTKAAKSDIKQSSTAAVAPAANQRVELSSASDNLIVVETIVTEQTIIEPETSDITVVIETPNSNIIAEPSSADIIDTAENEVIATISIVSEVAAAPVVGPSTAAAADNAIVFDEMGEWTDAKPDRKRGNKKKTRKD